MKQPLDGFADRLIRNDEVEVFIKGLIEKGVSRATIKAAITVKPSGLIWVCCQERPFDAKTAERLGITQILHPDANEDVCPHCNTTMNQSMLV